VSIPSFSSFAQAERLTILSRATNITPLFSFRVFSVFRGSPLLLRFLRYLM
jgi:hypothetical protein